MRTTRRPLRAEPLTAAAWEPFGWIPVADTDPADAQHACEFAWGDAHVNVISHSPSEVDRVDGGIVCDRFYRHDTHTQVLLPLDVDSVVAVAPAATTFETPDDLDAVRAFTLRPLDGFALARGTWHWGPFPLGEAPIHLWNLQGRRYQEDNACAELASRVATVLTIEVAP